MAIESAGIALGCLSMALAFHLFWNSNGIVGGGVVGLSTLFQRQFGIEPALFQWGLNLPLLGIAFWVLGKQEGIQSLLGTFLLPLLIFAFRGIPLATKDTLLAAVFGSLLYGVGLGLVLRNRGSVGGYSLLARLLVRKGVPFTVPGIILFCDSLTIIGSLAVFGIDKGFYGLLAAFALRRVVDRVVLGFGQSFTAMIVSAKPEGIRQRILEEMDRGLTILPGEGGFTGEPRPVLMTVVSQLEVPALRRLVQESDPDAFMFLSTTTEVVGRGFVRH